ncbi:hypothetical protein ACFL1H_00850 [Nanoarchaeota archaeon]
MTRGQTLWNKLFSKDEINIKEYHGRTSAWDFLLKRETQRYEKFIKDYIKSSNNKCVYDRINFIEQKLRRFHYQSIEEISGETIDMFATEGNGTKIGTRRKYYIKHQDTMIIAIQIGYRPIMDGVHIVGAHVDSPCFMGGIRKLKQNYNLAYIPATPVGGLQPKDFFDVPLSLYFRGIITDRNNNDKIIEFKIGDNEKDPVFIFPETSYHLGENQDPDILQINAIVGNMPYNDKRFDPTKRIVLNVMDELFRKYKIIESSLNSGELIFYPAFKSRESAFDRSLIAAYGQDNWASVYPLLHGFLETKNPNYTKIAVFYNGEEIGDMGRGALRNNYFSEIALPALANLATKNQGGVYKMLRNGWSLFLDVTEPPIPYDIEQFDLDDSAYFGSGIGIIPSSGSTAEYNAYRTSPEYKKAIMNLFDEKKIKYQECIHGTYENKIGSGDLIYQDLAVEGIYMGVPCSSLHRYTELISKIDLWNLAKAVNAFYSVENHKDYIISQKCS